MQKGNNCYYCQMFHLYLICQQSCSVLAKVKGTNFLTPRLFSQQDSLYDNLVISLKLMRATFLMQRYCWSEEGGFTTFDKE